MCLLSHYFVVIHYIAIDNITEWTYTHAFDNLDKIDNFFKKYNLCNLSQEETDNI